MIGYKSLTLVDDNGSQWDCIDSIWWVNSRDIAPLKTWDLPYIDCHAELPWSEADADRECAE